MSTASASITLADFFRDTYQPLRLLGSSPRTAKLYARTIRLFAESLGRPATLADFDDMTVARHLARLLAGGAAPATANKERDQLVAMWNLAAKKRLVDQFPEVRAIKEPERIPQAWTLEQLFQLKTACRLFGGRRKKTYDGVPAGKWWNALILSLYATGERVSAMLQVRWDDLTGERITFRAETRKGGRKPNVCHLPGYALEALGDIRNPERELVFPFPYSETYIYRLFHEILVAADLPADRFRKFHALRRTHATFLKAAGGDPTLSLGHSNPAVTAAYIDPRQLPDRTRELLPAPSSPFNDSSAGI